MLGQISLNGSDWLYKDFVGEDWIWRNSEKPDTRDCRFWRKGSVPGTVLHDLWQNAEVPDPYFERNSLLAEWVPQRTWVYKKTFEIDPALRGSRIQLRFEGVDYEAQFFLNGKPIGRHKGMYTPAVFEVNDTIHYVGENLLAVVIEKAPDEQPQVSKTSYVRTHKSRMTYWWDFCPRMVHQGIWDDVYLEVTGPVRLEDVYVRPRLAEDLSSAELSVSLQLSSTESKDVWVEMIIYDREETVLVAKSKHHVVSSERISVNTSIELPQPKLWQPNGSGEANLYEAQVIVTDEAGSLSAKKKVSFGVRKVELEMNDTPEKEALPYVFVVNGKRTYIKGWNWVPIDVMYGVPRPAKLERLLQLARRAGVNMLRVWGGGLIEKEAFYELCDRYGIMVWQEFIQSSSGIGNKPSEEPEFIDMMVREAEIIVPRKRNHASLVLWCGGNELQGADSEPLDDTEPVLTALKAVVNEQHPDALWLATSPTGRCFSNSLENIEQDPHGLHDVHGPWEHQGLTAQYTLYNKGTSMLHSEFGVEGMTHFKTLNRTISEVNQWPATRDNPVYFHRGSWWNNEVLVQASFGGKLERTEDLIRASQYLQAEGLRYAVESNLRRSWQNSGTLPWQFNEPYPNAYCTSALDYYTNPKPAYYGVANAYAAVSISASFAGQAWAGQDLFQADIWTVNSLSVPLLGKVQAKWQLTGATGRIYGKGEREGELPTNNPVNMFGVGMMLNVLEEDIFFLDLLLVHGNETIASNRYAFTRIDTLEPLLQLPDTTLKIDKLESGVDQWELVLTNTGDQAAFQLHLDDERDLDEDGYWYASLNNFTLLVGETQKIIIDWSGVPADSRKLELAAWNTTAVKIG
jgi:beta-mannosidase